MKSFVLKGDVAFCTDKRQIATHKNAYVVCKDGVCQGVFDTLPSQFKSLPLADYSGKLIVPGMTDLHVHAPQFQFRGTGMDLPLLPWLDKYAFKEEAKYSDTAYAKKAYAMFADALVRSFTTRAVIFATLHKNADLILADELEKTGLKTALGLVNMDRNSPSNLVQSSVKSAVCDTEEFILATQRLTNVTPVITPRFLPSCSDELMQKLGELRAKYGLAVQSHLDENADEIALVKTLTDAPSYAHGYQKFGLFGKDHNCVMAHCVHCTADEIELIKQNGVFVAHCPESNMNVSSGIAPVSSYVDNGVKVGIGSDVAGGSSLSLMRAGMQAVQMSKLYKLYVNQNARILDFWDVFYMLTKGGGEFFGKVGSFENGYEFDALVLDDSKAPSLVDFTLAERIERMLYVDDQTMIVAKYCGGEKIL